MERQNVLSGEAALEGEGESKVAAESCGDKGVPDSKSSAAAATVDHDDDNCEVQADTAKHRCATRENEDKNSCEHTHGPLRPEATRAALISSTTRSRDLGVGPVGL